MNGVGRMLGIENNTAIMVMLILFVECMVCVGCWGLRITQPLCLC